MPAAGHDLPFQCLCPGCSLYDQCAPDSGRPVAVAIMRGGPLAPRIRGRVVFRQLADGVEVAAQIRNLPPYRPAQNNQPPIGPHGFHIHEFGNCQTGNPANPFQDAGGHWNPTGQPHGNHAGDLPVLFSNHGRAYMVFFTDKFAVRDVIGKAVIIHESPDDYRTQPAGAAGRRLACGVIRLQSG